MQTIYNQQKAYFKLGHSQSISYRLMMLSKLKKTIKAHEAKISVALATDLNKSKQEAYLSEFFMIYKSIDYTIKNLDKWANDQKVKTPIILKPAKSYTRSLPYGNTLILNAYNYPLLLAIDPIIGAIAGGNTIMLGLSKKAKATNQVIIKMLNTTFDPEYLYAFETDRKINQELFAIPFDKFFFTGSGNVGKLVYQAAAKHMAAVTLELGGKSPAIVLRDANLKETAKSIIYSKGLNAGQTCVATDYILVDEMIADDLISELKAAEIKMYPSLNDYPKLIDKKAFNLAMETIETDKDYLVNDFRTNPETNQLSVVLIKADSDIELKAMEVENFNPILPIITYPTLEAAIDYARKYPNPLALYVFGKRKANIYKMIRNLPAGGVSINATIFHMVNQHLPFSGYKSSGIGAYHGKHSFQAFTYEQAVYHKYGFRIQNLILPPYKRSKSK